MTRSLLVAVLLAVATPAAAQEAGAPDKGAFGLGAFFFGTPVTIPGFTPGLSASFWAIDKLTVNAVIGLNAVESEDTHFLVMAGVDYYVLKNPAERFGAFVGGSVGVNVNPGGGLFGRATNDQILFRLQGGGEYYASEHLGIYVSEGLDFNTEPTSFGFGTQLGVRVYF